MFDKQNTNVLQYEHIFRKLNMFLVEWHVLQYYTCRIYRILMIFNKIIIHTKYYAQINMFYNVLCKKNAEHKWYSGLQ